MSTIATVTPNVRPGYDRNMLESLSNRRENVPLIVVVVGDRTSKISHNKVDGHVQNCLRSVCDYKSHLISLDRTTNRVWSHHQSCVIVCQNSRTISSSTSHKLLRLVVRPIIDASHDLHLQSIVTIGGTCKSAITNDWRRGKVWPIVVNRPTNDHLITVNNTLLVMNEWMPLFSERHTHIKFSQ